MSVNYNHDVHCKLKHTFTIVNYDPLFIVKAISDTVTNTLTYYTAVSVTAVKSFIGHTPVACTINI